jgi:heme/copper-type cytochrome/quinol oxidase subunit 4
MPDENEKMTEAEAIAEVVRLGEELRYSSKTESAWYALRIGVGLVFIGIALLMLLFAYAVMSKGAGFPIVGLVFASIVVAGGVVAMFWGLQNKQSGMD